MRAFDEISELIRNRYPDPAERSLQMKRLLAIVRRLKIAYGNTEEARADAEKWWKETRTY